MRRHTLAFLAILSMCAIAAAGKSDAAAAETDLAPAPESIDIELPGGTTLTIERHTSRGDHLLLWLPSEHGTRPPQTQIADRLAKRGIEVWIADLHTAYFVPVGRSSMDQFPVEDTARLIEHARTLTGKRVFLAATGRGAQLALRAARAVQLAETGDPDLFGGVILFHPYLYGGRPQPGEDPPLLPVARGTNLPVFLIQPTLSAKHWRGGALAQTLSEGGAAVFTQALPGVTDGFHLRTDDDLSETDLAARRTLPGTLQRAMDLMTRLPSPPQPAPLPDDTQETPGTASPTMGLTALEGPAPTLSLPDGTGRTRSLDSLRGQVVLVSFWASWCPPCVEEMPSLDALNERLAARGFRVVSVNVGEDEATVRAFLREHPVDFAVLRDPQGRTVEPWKVYAYPTNYLIDASGRLRYGRFGAMDWTSPAVLETIDALLNETEG